MLREQIKNIKSEKSELRNFGITVGIVLGLLGSLFLWREKNFYSYFLISSAVLILLGLIFPILLKPIHKVWMTLAVTLGWVMTRVILGILFYLVLTSIKFLATLFGTRFLDLKMDNSKKSYWIHREPREFKKSEYERQF
jgi:hypothetical protein